MKRLILMGEIGAGKSTLIRNALGAGAARAGGFVTRRVLKNGRLQGFELAPARIWSDPNLPAHRFLDFSRGKRRDDSVFSGPGAALLAEALHAPFAVADEFGGLELLVPEFYEGLVKLLSSDVPTIGVFKTPGAVQALSEQIPLGDDYARKVDALRTMLEADPETLFLPIAGWDDNHAIETVRRWTEIHGRR